MKQTLWIDASAGISADRFVAALIGLGLPEREMVGVIKSVAEDLGMLDAHTHLEFLPDERLAHRLHLIPLEEQKPLPWEEVPATLEHALTQADVSGTYADFAQQVLLILRTAEASGNTPLPLAPAKNVSLPIIGTAHTPYKHKAPYQPQPENVGDGAFYIQVEPQYAAATYSLETFSHIFVLSYLDKSLEAELSVRPPWKDDDKRYGTFATRSPNRPSPIGLTRVRLRRVEGARIYTGPLDLFNGTPILDIKPFIRSLDGMADDDDAGNDGWLEGSDHLELHRLGIPHTHPGGSGTLAQPQTLIAILTGLGWGLQSLGVDLSSVVCTSPMNTGTEYALELATRSILEQYKIPCQSETDSGVLVTPYGAAILAALSPQFAAADDVPSTSKRTGLGLGGQILAAAPAFGALRLILST
ncbi:MAG: tRNA (N6-threonylcarbamoyladenosine(37)-N6)-methyltransferase TrmO [Chloroflexota bacterium]|nr:tRNA (N6-threonylcarbamoyladenosine(37)-N6)-methyltransferase TrmO [Chloroflexota bacterium]